MKGTNSMFDIIIIGSGPAGLSAAIYAKRANLNVAVAEKEYAFPASKFLATKAAE